MNKKVAAPVQKTEINGRGDRCADHVTPLYPQKLAPTSPTGGGRSVGIVRLRTKATECVCVCVCNVETYRTAGQATHENMADKHCTLNT